MSSEPHLRPFSWRNRILKGLDAFLSWATFFVSQKAHAIVPLFPHPDIEAFVQEHSFFSNIRPLVGCVTSSKRDLQRCVKLLQLIEQQMAEGEVRQLAFAEVMTKLIAYRDLQEGMCVHAYVVDKVFDLWRGMPAFGLVSLEGRTPILLFRGTDANFKSRRGRASMLTDLDWRGPGFSLFQRTRPQLCEWLNGKQARVMGCSLGGALTAYVALYEGALLSQTLPSIAINPPGVFKKNRQLWEVLVQRPPLITYVTAGDLVSKVGHLIGDVRLVGKPSRLKPIEAHNKLMFAEN